MQTQSVKVTQKENAPEVPTEIIAQSIVDMSRGVRKLVNSRLNERALIVLLKDACGGDVSMQTIQKVLHKLQDLERLYIKKQVN
jgi:hypothetical protein